MKVASLPLVLPATGFSGDRCQLVRHLPAPSAIIAYSRGRFSRGITGIYPTDDGHLLVGFGDGNLNGGKVPVLELDPVTGDVLSQSFLLRSENISTLRNTGDGLIAPYTDPVGASFEDTPSGRKWRVYARRDSAGSWVECGDMKQIIHAFDAVVLGGKLFLCGSIYPGHAAVVTPGDDAVAGEVVAAEPERGDFHRFYRFYPHTDMTRRLYNKGTGRAYIFDGETLVPDVSGWSPMTPSLMCPRTDYQLVISSTRWRLYRPDGVLVWDFRGLGDTPTAFAFVGEGFWVGYGGGSIKYCALER